jgi:hypothetical protein
MRALILTLALAALLYATKAPAHDAPAGWAYDLACCGLSDCAPVADGIVVENPRNGAVTVLGYTLDRADPRIRVSKDDQDHVCQSPSKLLCVYLKPKGN